MKRIYYIDYPQEPVEGHAFTYRCAYCKEITTKINGTLRGHLPSCTYRLDLERQGFVDNDKPCAQNYISADEFD